jgi:hypothetical protein
MLTFTAQYTSHYTQARRLYGVLEKAEMNSRFPRSVPIPLALAFVASLLLLIVEVTMAPLAGWTSGAYKSLLSAVPPQQSEEAVVTGGASEPREKNRCEHCGIVESTRRVPAVDNAPAMYEVTVRLADRTKRVFSDPNARWRPGERIVLIDGGRSKQE